MPLIATCSDRLLLCAWRDTELPAGHPLQPHVLYRIRRRDWEARR